jgi:prepilin-type N-terminal cleavage/methylation domain-containing protein
MIRQHEKFHDPHRRGFTLVEMLVVVLIIMVLLALLVSALDKAIYEAEISTCSQRQSGLAAGALQYAMNNAGYYPTRAPSPDWQPMQLAAPRTTDGNTADLRPMLREVAPIENNLSDPLTENLEFDSAGADSYIYASYALWFGWSFIGADGLELEGMKKLGQSLTWSHPAGQPHAPVWRLETIVSDLDLNHDGSGYAGSHPDRHGMARMDSRLDEPLTGEESAGLAESDGRYTYSLWRTDSTGPRGLIDLNVAFQEGSVARYHGLPHEGDGRTIRVPARQRGDEIERMGINLPLH